MEREAENSKSMRVRCSNSNCTVRFSTSSDKHFEIREYMDSEANWELRCGYPFCSLACLMTWVLLRNGAETIDGLASKEVQ